MAGLSTYAARKVLEHIFKTPTFVKPSNLFWALFTADPTDAGLLVAELPIGVNGYARVSVPVSDEWWSGPTTVGNTEQIANALAINFGNPTGNWGGGSGVPITWAAVMDAGTAGNMVGSGPLGTPRTVLVTDNAPSFGPGALTISLV